MWDVVCVWVFAQFEISLCSFHHSGLMNLLSAFLVLLKCDHILIIVENSLIFIPLSQIFAVNKVLAQSFTCFVVVPLSWFVARLY